jgi:hypothetical protein
MLRLKENAKKMRENKDQWCTQEDWLVFSALNYNSVHSGFVSPTIYIKMVLV